MNFRIPDPELQVAFAASLERIRKLCLQEALSKAVRKLKISQIDLELAIHVPAGSLAALAGHGLRGELMFPVPAILQSNPRLLGYYRLLYGYSQKEFYTSSTGATRFKQMEEQGLLGTRNLEQLPALCTALCQAGTILLAGIGLRKIKPSLLEDLTLLTLGPQLRGGANVRRGTAGIRSVFNVIEEIVHASVVSSTETMMELYTAAGRRVLIEFASDPDIVVREEMRTNMFRKVIAIEVKAGQDFSDIHNRIGEAEKSHQKAKANGFSECWTVVNVDKIDMATAHRESPSTNRFYRVSDLISGDGADFQDFRDRIVSLVGIKSE